MTTDNGFHAELVRLLSEALDEPVDPSDHFVDVGGDSLTAALVADQISDRFGVIPDLAWFFECESIAELADRCMERNSDQT